MMGKYVSVIYSKKDDRYFLTTTRYPTIWNIHAAADKKEKYPELAKCIYINGIENFVVRNLTEQYENRAESVKARDLLYDRMTEAGLNVTKVDKPKRIIPENEGITMLKNLFERLC